MRFNPVIVSVVVLTPETYAPVVPVAAAVALAGNRTQELGAVVHAVPKVTVQLVSAPVPMVSKKELSVPVTDALVPHELIDGDVPPREAKRCPP